MKIIFLCGSLEPGKDGVGDYVRRLSCELVKQGHHASAVAINDGHIIESLTEVQTSENIHLSVLRMSSRCPDKQRLSSIKQWIDVGDPDWISLQFVPFSFHPKGLPFNLIRQLKYLGKGRRWHLMFHELWVGMDITTSTKQLVLGWFQKRLIRSLIRNLQPACIHTQARLYQFHLGRLGFYSKHLPLFSNIPKTPVPLDNPGLEERADCNSIEFSLVLFGSIHPGAPVELLAKEAARYFESTGIRMCLKFIGVCGPEQNFWAQTWKSNGLPVKILGKQSTNSVSKVLSEAVLGISTTPPALLDKSGAVAAMVEHGLPVLTVSRSWQPRGADVPPLYAGIMEYAEGNFAELLNRKPTYHFVNCVSDVARKLADTLTS